VIGRTRRCVTRLLLAAVAGGMLAGGCASVRPHLMLPDLVLGEPSFFPTIESYALTPIVGGNRIDLLLNGEQIFPAMLDAIRSAEKSITFAQYIYEGGPIAETMTSALADSCRRGVTTNILLDGFGALQMPPVLRDTLTDAGCQVISFRPLGPPTIRTINNRNHRRILVVDGRVGFTGGSGVTQQWAGDGVTESRWRETDVRVEGPVVEQLQGAFAENWLEATGEVLGGDEFFPRPQPDRGQAFAHVIRSSPAGGSFAIYTTLLLAILSARRTIYLTNPYFLPDAAMLDALVQAHRKVRVVVLVPGLIDHQIVRQAGKRHYGDLLRVGAEIFEYMPALLHSKTLVVDGVWSTIGSTNLDNRSFALNDELNLVIYSRDVASRLERILEQDLARSRQVTYEAWRHRGIMNRLIELLLIPFRGQL
jgi:cardiolipin synthase A/B